MSLMGNLYIGASGLQTGQNALNTTAHNMSNIDTTGYTRQQVQQGTRFYNTISKNASAVAYQQVGLGVNYSQAKQIRDYFLDKTYRREVGRGAYYDTAYDVIEEVENIFQELDGEAFADTISNLWTSVQELAKEPANPVTQGTFIQRCNEFVTRSNAVYSGLKEYQDNLNYKIKQEVDTINDYGERITELNEEILKIESGGVEHANDLKDERNQLIDELAKKANISCKTDVEGNILIQIEGVDFVKADPPINEMKLDVDETTGFYTPYWSDFATRDAQGNIIAVPESAHVFDLTQKISTDTNTDIGALKSMMLARGDERSTYDDLAPLDHYENDIAPSILMNVMAEFDQLVNKVTTKVNDIIKDAADTASGYLIDAGTGQPYKVFDTIANDNNYTVENIVINETLKESPSLLGFVKADDTVDYDTTAKIKEAFTENSYTLNPLVKTTTNFQNYYNNLISQVSNSGSVLKGISESQQITVDSTAAAREQILGVSSDEEMSNMIMFQNAYNAASRYINVISEMMEHVINTLGR